MRMFLNIIELAESLGVDESGEQSWVRLDGLPQVTDRGCLLFDRVQVVDRAATRGMAVKCGFLAPERLNDPGKKHLETRLRIFAAVAAAENTGKEEGGA
jgi:hypothetical protein